MLRRTIQSQRATQGYVVIDNINRNEEAPEYYRYWEE